MGLGTRSVLIRQFGWNSRRPGYHSTSGKSPKSFIRPIRSEDPRENRSSLAGSNCGAQPQRWFSGGWSAVRGHDITSDSLEWGSKPKINITGFSESGFNVKNMMKLLDARLESDTDGTVHMNGSMIAFPNAAFLWSIEEPKDVTIESLSSVLLYRPKLDYLFIGCDGGYGSIPQLTAIQNHMRLQGVCVEQMMLHNAIGTFNVLNGEDRLVAVALLMAKEFSP
jgi:uncharacterized protein